MLLDAVMVSPKWGSTGFLAGKFRGFSKMQGWSKCRLRVCVLAICMSAALAACQNQGERLRGDGGAAGGNNRASVEQVLAVNPNGEVIGTGTTRIALLVPTSVPGGASQAARELRNGAALAMDDFGSQTLQLVVKDTAGQSPVAQDKASEAIREGASLILGPLFSANVAAASGVTLPANKTMIAFSTDTNVARKGVYLLSYTPQADTRRIIEYSAKSGQSSLTAFLARNAEGSLRERILREVAGRSGIQVNVVKYDRSPEGVRQAAAEGLPFVQQSGAIYIPEGGPLPAAILTDLNAGGVELSTKQILGSGNWESVDKSSPLLTGALYPGRDLSRFDNFSNRYRSKFGSQPGVQAALAYDAVTLASELARINANGNPYGPRRLESARGFSGVNGIFRLGRNGVAERGLSIYRVANGIGTLADPAPTSFSRSS